IPLSWISLLDLQSHHTHLWLTVYYQGSSGVPLPFLCCRLLLWSFSIRHIRYDHPSLPILCITSMILTDLPVWTMATSV
ncbi:hypothetical protein C8F04DRAFT_1112302, partial [Mycena alexandri]